jgi:hypothetical protein
MQQRGEAIVRDLVRQKLKIAKTFCYLGEALEDPGKLVDAEVVCHKAIAR